MTQTLVKNCKYKIFYIIWIILKFIVNLHKQNFSAVFQTERKNCLGENVAILVSTRRIFVNICI